MEKKIKKPKIVKATMSVGDGVEIAQVSQTPPVEVKKDDKPYVTYVLMFTIAGHKIWRASMYAKKEDHDVYMSKQLKHPPITEKRWFVCDRITGTITEEK